jgi:hypothetical protein
MPWKIRKTIKLMLFIMITDYMHFDNITTDLLLLPINIKGKVKNESSR